MISLKVHQSIVAEKDKRIAELEALIDTMPIGKEWDKVCEDRDHYKKALEKVVMMLDGTEDGVDKIISNIAQRALKEKP